MGYFGQQSELNLHIQNSNKQHDEYNNQRAEIPVCTHIVHD
jgi:hypothetical protein